MSANEARVRVRDKYKTILGRNHYSQARRSYVFKKHGDGKYYSDCSSSIAACYRECGWPITYNGSKLPNTVGMYLSRDLADVPVVIKNGAIQNPEILRLGDMLLFAGTDSSRASAGYVGHVEMVGEILSSGKVILYGHGSGTPRSTEMNAYCKQRYSAKTGTKLGNKGLIRVRRRLVDDGADHNTAGNPTETEKRILKNGCTGADVKELQRALIALGYCCGPCGADGEFGDATEKAVRAFQKAHDCEIDGEAGPETMRALQNACDTRGRVRIAGGNCWLRKGAGTSEQRIRVLQEGTVLPYAGETAENGWLLVECEGTRGWISGKYGRLVM